MKGLIVSTEVSFKKSCWDNVSPEAIDFMKKCLDKNIESRYSAKKLLDHKWMTEMKDEKPIDEEVQK